MHLLYNIAGFYRHAGMERVLADKANWLVAHGYDVTILTTEQKGRPVAFELDTRVELIDLAIGYEDNNGRSWLNKTLHYPFKQLRHRRRLKEVLHNIKPDITISMFCNDVNLIPTMKDGSAKVLEVHFSRFKRLQYGRKGVWGAIDRIRSKNDERLIRKYDRFVVLTDEDAGNWGQLDNLRVIKNPVHFYPERPADLDTKTVIAVGRFTQQKGLERLLDAWAIVAPEITGWTLRLVGDGEERDLLEKKAERLGITGSIVLGRSESDMEAVYRHASILALPSRYEGLPMALIESQAFGVPAVAFNCQCGPKEIIEDGVSGLLVKEGDVPGLASALKRLMSDDGLRRRMGVAAFNSSNRWKIDTIMTLWDNLFKEILSSRQ